MRVHFSSWLCLFLLLALLPFSAAAQELVSLARSGDLEALRAALPEDSKPDQDSLVKPLFFASQSGHDDVVSYLLTLGASPDSTTPLGTALGIAARQNHADVVEVLLAAGANPGLPGGEDGRLPLDEAAERGAMDAARLLLQHGADVNAKSARYGWPALHLAASRNRAEMVAFLKEMGAGPKPVDPLKPEELESADLEEGRLIAIECGGCHNVTPGGSGWKQNQGPDLVGVVGRTKASVEGFPYSRTMRTLSGHWTPEELNIFLADPLNIVPGTTMTRNVLPDRSARVAVIAYLMGLTP